MSERPFQTLNPNVLGNDRLRRPQRESYQAITEHYSNGEEVLEVGIVLPVGCGKSGAITLTPFATKAARVLVIAPGVRIAAQLLSDFESTSEKNFYRKTAVLEGDVLPEVADIRGSASNASDVENADVAVRISSNCKAMTINCWQNFRKISSTSSSTMRRTTT